METCGRSGQSRSEKSVAMENLVRQCSTERKSVTVKTISREDVKNIIRKLDDKENVRRIKSAEGDNTPQRKLRKRFTDCNPMDAIAEVESDELPPEFSLLFRSRPSALLCDDQSEPAPVGFQTPKKRNSMLHTAQMSASRSKKNPSNESESPCKTLNQRASSKLSKQTSPIKTPRARRSSTQARTPSYNIRTRSSISRNLGGENAISHSESVQSPSCILRSKGSKTPIRALDTNITRTPYTTRKTTKHLLQKVKRNQSSSEDSSYSEESSGDSSEDGSDGASPLKIKYGQAPSTTPSSSKTHYKQIEDDLEPDDYFIAQSSKVVASDSTLCRLRTSASKTHSKQIEDDFKPDDYFITQSSKIVTSDNTLSRLRTPRLDQDTIQSLLAEVKTAHQTSVSQLIKDHLECAQQWLFSLWQGYSVVLHGLGSKLHLLNAFHQEFLSDCNVLVVNGFFPNITIKEILESILTQIFSEKHITADVVENVQLIELIQSRPCAEPLYLLVHNLDGTALRGDRAQSVLSRLARISNVHLIASIDHINAPLLWDQSKLRQYNFVWWDVTSFAPYLQETSYESSILLKNTSTLTLSSLYSVFKSLTQNAKKLFMLLAKNQLECDTSKTFEGIPFSEFYWKCRDAFIASSDGALRAQLTEFFDHKLVTKKRGVDGVEMLIIPIENGILSQFTENYEEN